jgi:hypothetical protein
MPARNERRFVTVVFCLHVALTSFVALHHERWRDEADPWLLLRDGGVATMLERTGYVGSPALWYLLQAPLVKLGLPYGSMTVLNVAIACAAVLLFLITAPFSRTLRALFALSFFPAYEYAVIARPYALLMLLLFAALAAWRSRTEHPLRFALCVALLANTTVHGLILAAILGGLYLKDRRFASPGALVLMLTGGLLSFVQLLPPAGAPDGHVLRSFAPTNAAIALANAFFPRVPAAIGALGGAAILLCVAFAVARNRVPRLFLGGSVAALLCVYVFVWFGALRHSGLIMLCVIGALWLAAFEGPLPPRPMFLLSAAFAVSTIATAATAVQEVREPFSAAAEMAAYLRTNGLAGRNLAAHRAAPAAAVLAYLPPTRCYYAGMQREGSYMLWDAAQRRGARMSYETAALMTKAHFGARPHLLLLNDAMPNAERRGYRLLHATGTPFRIRDERYLLYAPLGETR